ncbi:MAG: FMN-binding protein [Actinomycetes bacterium]
MGAVKIVAVVAGTVGGVGAILAYAPPHQGGGGITVPPTSSPTSSPTQSSPATQSPTPSSTPTPTTPTKVAPTKIAKPVPRKTIPVPKVPVNGTFTGDSITTQYGPVQVQIDIVAGKIIAARALQLPSATAKDAELNKLAVPYLIQETVKASSADIQGVGGATYTSQGWYDSLVSALARAGL